MKRDLGLEQAILVILCMALVMKFVRSWSCFFIVSPHQWWYHGEVLLMGLSRGWIKKLLAVEEKNNLTIENILIMQSLQEGK